MCSFGVPMNADQVLHYGGNAEKSIALYFGPLFRRDSLEACAMIPSLQALGNELWMELTKIVIV
jgi:hypothetical protein